tara:strand:- start:25 stop:303 length:279 start_codon:yes stop_codon:yes gene_type:complete
MTLSPQQISSLIKLRAIGWSQSEIAESLGISQQVVAYNLKKLKEKSKEKSPDEIFSAALLGGLSTGAQPHQMERISVLFTLMDQLTRSTNRE